MLVRSSTSHGKCTVSNFLFFIMLNVFYIMHIYIYIYIVVYIYIYIYICVCILGYIFTIFRATYKLRALRKIKCTINRNFRLSGTSKVPKVPDNRNLFVYRISLVLSFNLNIFLSMTYIQCFVLRFFI